ncbi:MAG: hypothetical protein IKT98_06610 [Selenomonadaceae bacterium]|nr:hypothetical protein [Selenomonadaceae bacterium]
MEGKKFLNGKSTSPKFTAEATLSDNFVFDLQRFDNAWSLTSNNIYEWGIADGFVASLQADHTNHVWSLGGGGSESIIALDLTVKDVNYQASISSSISSDSLTAFDANSFSSPFKFTLSSDNKLESIAAGGGGISLDASRSTVNVSLLGGAGADSFLGGKGADVFIYNGQGSDSINGFTADDFVSLNGASDLLNAASVSVDGGNLIISDGTNTSLTFVNGATNTKDSVFTIKDGTSTFYFTKDYIMNEGKNAVSLTAAGSVYSAAADVVSIDASGINSNFSITANSKGNYIIGSSVGNAIYDGGGNDTVSLGSGADIFYYKGGADSIVGFGVGTDSIKLDSKFSQITDGSKLTSLTNGFKLEFDKDNSLTFTNFANSGSSIVSVYGSDTDINPYQYTATAISLKGTATGTDSVTLGASYDSSSFTLTNFTYINAAAVSLASGTFSVSGSLESSSGNYIVGSDYNVTSILGSSGNDTLYAGKAGASLVGNGGKDQLYGYSGDVVDHFFLGNGSASIYNYNIEKDVVSLTAGAAPTGFASISGANSNGDFIISVASGTESVVTFKNTSAFSLKSGSDIYYYEKDRILMNGDRITLGGKDYSGSKTFNVNKAGDLYSRISSIDASAVSVTGGLTIYGNENSSTNSIIGAFTGGKIIGNDKGDVLISGATSSLYTTTFEGGDGADTLIGSSSLTNNNDIGSKDIFVYTGGADSIANYIYKEGDYITVKASEDINFDESTAQSIEGGGLVISFSTGNSLSISGGTADNDSVSVKSGSGNYVYKMDGSYYVKDNKYVTLTSSFADSVFSASTAGDSVKSIYAYSAAGKGEGDNAAISIVGNDLGNTITGISGKANSLTGGNGNDLLKGGSSNDVFFFTKGKDVIEGFEEDKDNLVIENTDLNSIKSGKATKNKLTFTIDKSNAIAFKPDEDKSIELPTRISLNSGGYLTEDGIVSISSDSGNSLKLFSNAKGKIDLTSDVYSLSSRQITSLDASPAKDQTLTLVGASVGSDATFNLTLASDNKKKDVFVYGGGQVSISNYETGYDRIDLGSGKINGFSISGGAGGTGGDVIISVSGGDFTPTNDIVSISGAQGKDVYIKSDGKKPYARIVFKEPGVFYDREKNPSSATVFAGAASLQAAESIKKIYALEGIEAISIKAGDKNNTLIDASEVTLASGAISLIGGAKNDKLIGSKSADVFVYTNGKDVINGFSTDDSISLGSDLVSSIQNAKITTSSKSIKFKFSTKNALTIKGESKEKLSGEIDIVGVTKYTFGKNQYSTVSNTVSLTSEYSGSFNTKGTGYTIVDGSKVTKNLSFKGTDGNETLIGGTGKTAFKGGAGADSLVGGTGADTFFYAKGDKATVQIANFDTSNKSKDKLKIANSTLRKVSYDDNNVTFSMNNGKKDSANIASFNVQGITNPNKTLIHANNTYYWFAKEAITEVVTVDGGTDTITVAGAGDLITWSDKKVSSSQAKEYAVIDLSYSTNLAKSGVAVNVSSKNDKAKLPDK